MLLYFGDGHTGCCIGTKQWIFLLPIQRSFLHNCSSNDPVVSVETEQWVLRTKERWWTQSDGIGRIWTLDILAKKPLLYTPSFPTWFILYRSITVRCVSWKFFPRQGLTNILWRLYPYFWGNCTCDACELIVNLNIVLCYH